jgi:hypothetical protein
MEMEFGRLDGFVTLTGDGQRWLTVVLDTGREVETVRDEAVPPGMANQDAAWLADQFVQEAVGNELSLEGWEVVGEGDTRGEEHRMLDVVARSRTLVLRRTT